MSAYAPPDLASLPKCELHVHLEGTFAPDKLKAERKSAIDGWVGAGN